MKKTLIPRLLSIVIILACTTSLSAQNLYLHYNDGELLYLGKDNVDSITFSNYDADSVYHDEIVTQVIHTSYTKYQIPISTIDSISCVNQDKSNLSCPDNNHPHMIDLGLPSGTKWACCNVGASKPEGYGGYYAWGETSEKEDYTPSKYKCAVIDDINGWQQDGDHLYRYINLGESICGTGYDVAHVRWGSSWQMPSIEQFKEIEDNCEKEQININGVNGCLITGPNGGSIFLPFAGCRYNIYPFSDLHFFGDTGLYWSGTYDSVALILSHCFICDMISIASWCQARDIYEGESVRPVAK